MAPNLFVAARTACQPHKWFRTPSPPTQIKQTEEWEHPVPGRYKHTAQGWYLIATKDTTTGTFTELDRDSWRSVIYWHPKKRFELRRCVEKRSQDGYTEDDHHQKHPRKFYCMPEDGGTWIQCWDKFGEESIPGPYQRYVLDAETKKFRRMTKGDERLIRRIGERDARAPSRYHDDESAVSSLHPSRANSPAVVERRPHHAAGGDDSDRKGSVVMPDVKRQSLTVPEARRPSSNYASSSRSGSSSRASTPSLEKDMKGLNARLDDDDSERGRGE